MLTSRLMRDPFRVPANGHLECVGFANALVQPSARVGVGPGEPRYLVPVRSVLRKEGTRAPRDGLLGSTAMLRNS
jgi:hypothetical protein